jgi:hypothetical protein
VHGIIVPKRRSAGLSYTVGKASAGAVEHMNIARVTNIAATVDELKARGVWVFGADMNGTDYNECDFSGSCAIVIGNEGKGISRLVREKCDVWEPSDNVTIYGHNMLNGTMFADLHDYEEKSFWKNNKLVYFDTLYEYHTYEIFAVFIVSGYLDQGFNYHTFDDAANAAEFDEFVATCKELALYDTGITPKYGEKLITLSTCDKSIENGRLVVVARRIM